jgi:[acyl-carrier-protein] S-malonyltransferase
MLADLAAAYPSVLDTFREASDAVELDLWRLAQEGPDETLDRTEMTQPVMLAAGAAVWRVWRGEGGPLPAFMAGHSLGEYTALVCAGSLELSDAVRLARFRGRTMQKAVPAGAGAMAAVLGLDDAAIRRACRRFADGQVLEPANFNSPGQVVVAGHASAVQRLIDNAREAGARKVIPVKISVPSHCSLMREAADRLDSYLGQVTIHPPKIPVLHNATVAAEHQVGGLRRVLAEQLYSPVRWAETIQAFAASGVDKLVECGPGKVLAGLNRRIDKSMQAFPVFDPAGLEQALAAVNAPG